MITFKRKMDGALQNLFLPEEFAAWHHWGS